MYVSEAFMVYADFEVLEWDQQLWDDLVQLYIPPRKNTVQWERLAALLGDSALAENIYRLYLAGGRRREAAHKKLLWMLRCIHSFYVLSPGKMGDEVRI